MAKCHTKKLYGDLFAVQMWAGQGTRYGKSKKVCFYHICVGISLESWQKAKGKKKMHKLVFQSALFKLLFSHKNVEIETRTKEYLLCYIIGFILVFLAGLMLLISLL